MKSLKDLKEELLNLMRAKTPIIYIVGTDENQILHNIVDCASAIKLDNMKRNNIDPDKNTDTKGDEADDSYGLFEWSGTKGLLTSKLVTVKRLQEESWINPINGEKAEHKFEVESKTREDSSFELDKVLEAIGADYPKNKIYNFNHRTLVLKDVHKYLEENPFVVRRIKEVALFEDRNDIISHQIIIVSPVKVIPVEFQNYIHVIEWLLPDKDEVLSYLVNTGAIALDEKKGLYRDTKTNVYYQPDDLDNIVSNLSGLSFPEIKNITNISIQKKSKLDQDLLLDQKRQMILKNGLLEYSSYEGTTDDIGGMDVFKEWVSMRKNLSSKEALKYGIESPKGALLVGIPGCGKSQFAKVIAAAWGRPLLRLDIGKVFGGTVGKSEEQIRLALATIDATTPNVVLIDEIDKSLSGVQSSAHSDSGTTSRVVGTILTWLNDKKKPSFVIGTANSVRTLPPALLRKGRFDEIFFVGLPTADERHEIFAIHLRRKGRDAKKFDIKAFVEASENFSGAEIEEAIKTALITAFHKGKPDLTNEDVMAALSNIIPAINTSDADSRELYKWVGWDDAKKDGIRARFASKYKKRLFDEDGEVIKDAVPKAAKDGPGKVIQID
jgi:ATP-dependent 26S proteasome regulatory subunit